MIHLSLSYGFHICCFPTFARKLCRLTCVKMQNFMLHLRDILCIDGNGMSTVWQSVLAKPPNKRTVKDKSSVVVFTGWMLFMLLG